MQVFGERYETLRNCLEILVIIMGEAGTVENPEVSDPKPLRCLPWGLTL